jgi:hypothetical protein
MQTAKKRGDSHPSGARCVGRTHGTPTNLWDNEYRTHLEQILPTTRTLAITRKKMITNQETYEAETRTK